MKLPEKLNSLYDIYLQSRHVVTDSRAVTQGCIFFAFRGQTFDANAFVPQALETGAAACVTTDAKYATDPRCFVVDDVLSTLQNLARLHRSHLDIPVVAITGTNGKTTTKELTHAVLSRRYRTHATQGNLNNHIGVPLTLLATPADAEIVIVEMGASHPGEIEDLCAIASPDYGLITNCGTAHLEGFGSKEGVFRTKTELYRHLKVVGGTIFVSADDQRLLAEAELLAQSATLNSMLPAYMPDIPLATPSNGLTLVTYGSNPEAQTTGTLVDSNPYMKFYFEDGDHVYTVQSQLVGSYNFANAMAAVCIGQYFGVDLFDIKEAIEQYAPGNNRSQFRRTANNALILDCYNANPTSMELALNNFANFSAPNRWVVLGGMKELGRDSEREHRRIYNQLATLRFDHNVLIGPEFAPAAEGRWGDPLPAMQWFADSDQALAALASQNVRGATVLLKGSNSSRVGMVEKAF